MRTPLNSCGASPDLLAPARVWSQPRPSDEPTPVEPVVVTATKTAVPLSDVGSAITVAGGDRAHLQRAAHAIEGAVGTFGAQSARDLAAHMERAGREGRLDEAPALLGALEGELARVTTTLQEHAAPPVV